MEIRTRFQVELSETALGYTSLGPRVSQGMAEWIGLDGMDGERDASSWTRDGR